MGQKTTFSELLEKHQKLDKLREDLEGGIRGLRKGDGSEKDVEKDERPSVRLLHDRLKEVRSEIRAMGEMEVVAIPMNMPATGAENVRVVAYGTILRGDTDSDEEQLAQARTPAIAMELARRWNIFGGHHA